MYNEENRMNDWVHQDINEALIRIKREEEEYYRERELKDAQDKVEEVQKESKKQMDNQKDYYENKIDRKDEEIRRLKEEIRDLKILANNYECYRYGKDLIQSGNLNKDECEMIDAFLRIVERKFREEKQYQNKKEMFNHMKYVLVEEQKRLDEIKKQEEKKQRKEARKEKFKSFFRK